ncbi:MAG: hypothetical protein ACYC0T_00690 [Ramlibacter sp.]
MTAIQTTLERPVQERGKAAAGFTSLPERARRGAAPRPLVSATSSLVVVAVAHGAMMPPDQASRRRRRIDPAFRTERRAI